MLKIQVGAVESFDEEKEEFVEAGGFELEFEHSLVSLSKWESKYEKPFYGKDKKTSEETYFYIECMCVTENPPKDFLKRLTNDDVDRIAEYMESKQSATTFAETKDTPSRETVTSELVYYWMVAANIPFECETWNLNRLFNLIRVCNVKNSPPKKLSRSEIAARNRQLNAERRAKLGTKG